MYLNVFFNNVFQKSSLKKPNLSEYSQYLIINWTKGKCEISLSYRDNMPFSVKIDLRNQNSHDLDLHLLFFGDF